MNSFFGWSRSRKMDALQEICGVGKTIFDYLAFPDGFSLPSLCWKGNGDNWLLIKIDVNFYGAENSV